VTAADAGRAAMRTLLICHHDAPLDREGLVRWLGSFSTVAGTLVVREPGRRLRTRIRREVSRVGLWRFADVLAFRAFYTLACRRSDCRWEQRQRERLRARFPEWPRAPELIVRSPNSPDAEAFVRRLQPDLMIARCKTILREEVFSIPRLGTFVLHPGICPEYRNAHGCFWAMAAGDADNVGATLLRVDRGVDTGPVFGYFRVTPDPDESHVVTEHRAVLDHLDAIRDRLKDVAAGRARPLDTAGRGSAAWGQPWLTAYVGMRLHRTAAARGPHDSSRTVRKGEPASEAR